MYLHYFGNNGNLLGNRTHALVSIVLYPGTKKQRRIERSVVLKRAKEKVKVISVVVN